MCRAAALVEKGGGERGRERRAMLLCVLLYILRVCITNAKRLFHLTKLHGKKRKAPVERNEQPYITVKNVLKKRAGYNKKIIICVKCVLIAAA